jgi:hypothetical protein
MQRTAKTKRAEFQAFRLRIEFDKTEGRIGPVPVSDDTGPRYVTNPRPRLGAVAFVEVAKQLLAQQLASDRRGEVERLRHSKFRPRAFRERLRPPRAP